MRSKIGRVRHVGVLMAFAEADRDGRGPIQSFRQGLAGLGWIEGRNVRILVGWAGSDAGRNGTMRTTLF